MTSLPVLKNSSAASPEQLVRLFHQSQLEWARHLGDEAELDFGRWIGGAGCLLEAYLLPGMQPAELIANMSAKHDWCCCTLNPSMPIGQTAPLGDALLAEKWVPQTLEILHRSRKASREASEIDGLKIIPARAGFRHYRQLIGDESMLHLDDSHLDSLLALQDGQAIGCIGILTSGEVGTVRQWFVVPPQRHQGIEAMLLDRAMEICARGLLRHVMIGLPDSADDARHLCQTAGFDKIGQWLSFWKDSCKISRLFA